MIDSWGTPEDPNETGMKDETEKLSREDFLRIEALRAAAASYASANPMTAAAVTRRADAFYQWLAGE